MLYSIQVLFSDVKIARAVAQEIAQVPPPLPLKKKNGPALSKVVSVKT